MRVMFLTALWVVALSASTSGFQPNMQYTYEVESRMMTGIPQLKPQYSGMVIDYKLLVQTERNGVLTMKPVDIGVSKVNGELSDSDWRTGDIPDSSSNNLPSSVKEALQQSFICVYRDGVFTELKCHDNVPEWIRNWHKSHCALFQLDLQGRNTIQQSDRNTILKGPRVASRFTVRESTLQGDCPVVYDLADVPEFLARDQTEKLPLRDEVCPHGSILRVAKHKNLTDCNKSTAMSFGSPATLHFRPGINAGGRMQQHTSKATYHGCGNRNNFVPLQIIQEDIVCINPQLVDTQKAIGGSRSNFTLIDQKRLQQHIEKPSPSASHTTLHFKWSQAKYASRDGPLLVQPELDEPPMTPLKSLLFSRNPSVNPPSLESIKSKTVDLITKCIAPALISSGEIVSKNALMCTERTAHLLRLLKLNDVQDVWRTVRSARSEGKIGKMAGFVLGDLLAICGTNPCVKHLTDVIVRDEELKINSEKTVEIVSHMFSHVITPTQSLLKTALEFTKQVIARPSVSSEMRATVLGNMADLIYSSCVHPRMDMAMFPVNMYGLFCYHNSPIVHELFDVLKTEMYDALSNRDVEKQLGVVLALKTLGNSEIVQILLPIIKGQLDIVPDVQVRSESVLGLQRVAMVTDPKLVIPEILSIIQNEAYHPRIRTAAIALLPYIEVRAATWQHVATSTWYSMNKEAHCFFATMVRALATTKTDRFALTRARARAALPFVKPVQCGIQESRANLLTQQIEKLGLSYNQDIEVLGSRSSLAPDAIYLLTMLNMGGSMHIPTEMEVHFRSFQSIRNVLEDILVSVDESPDAEPILSDKIEEIKRQLNIRNREEAPVQGLVEITRHQNQNRFIPFGNGNMRERFRRFLQKQIDQVMSDSGLRGRKIHAGSADEQMIAFPSDLGFPVQIQFSSPMLFKAEADIKGESVPDIRNEKDHIIIPEKLKLAGDVEVGYGWAQSGRLSFLNPLEKEEISVEVHKQLVVGVEGKAKLCWKLENQGRKVSELIEFAPRAESNDNTVTLLHFSQIPATSVRKLVPVVQKHQSEHLTDSDVNIHPILANEEVTRVTIPVPAMNRLGLDVEIKHVIDSKSPDLFSLLKKMWKDRGIVSVLIAPHAMPSVELVDIQVAVKNKKSAADSIVLGWVYDSHSKLENVRRSNQQSSPWEDSEESSSDSKDSKIQRQKQRQRWQNKVEEDLHRESQNKNSQRDSQWEQSTENSQRHDERRARQHKDQQWRQKLSELDQAQHDQQWQQQSKSKLVYYHANRNGNNNRDESYDDLSVSSTARSIQYLSAKIMDALSLSTSSTERSPIGNEKLCKSKSHSCSRNQPKENILTSAIDDTEFIHDYANKNVLNDYRQRNRDWSSSERASTESSWSNHDSSTTESSRWKQSRRQGGAGICDIPELDRLDQILRQAFDRSEQKINPASTKGLAAIIMGMTKSREVIGHLEGFTALSSNIKGIISHVVAKVQRVEDGKSKPWNLDVDLVFKQPEIPIIKLKDIINMDIHSQLVGQIRYSDRSSGQNVITIKGEMDRTPAMKRYAEKESPEIKECEKKQLDLSVDCLKAGLHAATLNKYTIQIQHKIPDHTWLKNVTVQLGTALMNQLYDHLRVNTPDGSDRLGNDEMIVELEYIPGDVQHRCNITVLKKDRTLQFRNVPPINSVLKAAMPMDVIQLSVDRTLNTMLSDEYTPTCSLEKEHVVTLDNKTYTHQMTDCYHVVFMDCTQQGNVTVLAREKVAGKKELKVIVGENVVEVRNAGNQDEVTVNGRHVDLPTDQVKELTEVNENGFEDMWLAVRRSKFEEIILYMADPDITIGTDSVRVVLLVSNNFRNGTCGMCGDFNRDTQFEFRSPRQCILSSGTLAAASFMLKDGQCRVPTELVRKSEKEQQTCLTDTNPTIHQTSANRQRDQRRNKNSHNLHENGNALCKLQEVHVTRHIHGKQCNTQKKVPQCPDHCQPEDVSERLIQFQCIPGEHVKRTVEIPRRCVASQL